MELLRSEGMVLRAWDPADAPAFLDIYSRPEVALRLGAQPRRVVASPAEAAQRLDRWLARHDELEPPFGLWAIVADGSTPVGTALLLPLEEGGRPAGEVEVGWHLHPDAQGRGLATRAARALLDAAGAAGVPRVVALTDVDNERSAAVALRLGMSDEGVTDRWFGQPLRCFAIRPGGAWSAYDRLGDDFVRRAETSPWNALYDRPAVLAALGPVAGLRVLDAACGPGVYAEALLQAGAEVVGFDASEEMLDRARTRLGHAVRLDRARLDRPLPYPDGAFDRIVCALAIHYSDDRALTFREFARVLRPGGRAVVSTQHPTVDWIRKGGSYFTVARETDAWETPDGPVDVTYWREPLSALCRAALDAGLLVDRLDEPLPVPEMATSHPEAFATLSVRPDFLVLGLVKPSA